MLTHDKPTCAVPRCSPPARHSPGVPRRPSSAGDHVAVTGSVLGHSGRPASAVHLRRVVPRAVPSRDRRRDHVAQAQAGASGPPAATASTSSVARQSRRPETPCTWRGHAPLNPASPVPARKYPCTGPSVVGGLAAVIDSASCMHTYPPAARAAPGGAPAVRRYMMTIRPTTASKPSSLRQAAHTPGTRYSRCRNRASRASSTAAGRARPPRRRRSTTSAAIRLTLPAPCPVRARASGPQPGRFEQSTGERRTRLPALPGFRPRHASANG